jgi:hypothetical protein
MTHPYQFQRLDYSRKQIRLLDLQLFDDALPGHFPLRLETFDIESAPTYVALSYTWGEPNLINRISIGENYLQIGPNLHSFFEALRCSKKAIRQIPTIYLWIDQLCIDQQNVAERNNQVAMMSEIYSRAVYTLIWLNNDSQIYNKPSPWIAQEISRYLLPQYLSHKRLKESLPLYRYFTRKKTKKDTSTCLYEFLGHRYWSRLWVIQEVWLAQKTRIFTEGDVWLEWDHIIDLMNPQGQDDNWRFISAPSAMGLMFLAMSERILGKALDFTKKHALMSLLAYFDRVECSVPRDVVYGFMGIVEEELRIPIDYTKPIQDILLDVLLSGLKPYGCFNKTTLSKVGIRIGLTRSQHAAWDKMVAAVENHCEIPSESSYKTYIRPESLGFVVVDNPTSCELWTQRRLSLPQDSKVDGCWWYKWKGELYTFPCLIELNHDPGQNGPLANDFGDWRLLPQFAVDEPRPTLI